MLRSATTKLPARPAPGHRVTRRGRRRKAVPSGVLAHRKPFPFPPIHGGVGSAPSSRSRMRPATRRPTTTARHATVGAGPAKAVPPPRSTIPAHETAHGFADPAPAPGATDANGEDLERRTSDVQLLALTRAWTTSLGPRRHLRSAKSTASPPPALTQALGLVVKPRPTRTAVEEHLIGVGRQTSPGLPIELAMAARLKPTVVPTSPTALRRRPKEAVTSAPATIRPSVDMGAPTTR